MEVFRSEGEKETVLFGFVREIGFCGGDKKYGERGLGFGETEGESIIFFGFPIIEEGVSRERGFSDLFNVC